LFDNTGIFDPTAVVFKGDGEPVNNKILAQRLSSIIENNLIEEDNYSVGGTVAKLEKEMAEVLGKESAIFMPTGTLANHLAIRNHARLYPRAIVQERSHLYLDSGDSMQRLSSIHLVPLAPSRPYFTLAEVKEELEKSVSGRVLTPVGALMIESPVRRCHGRVMPFSEMKKITDLCKESGIGSHLDGARLFMMSATSGKTVGEYSELFDTIYVSMWKYFGAPFGAILAGNYEFCKNLHHERRMFGSGLPSASMAAALAIEGSKRFFEFFDGAVEAGNNLVEHLNSFKLIDATPFSDGSNIFPVKLSGKVDCKNFCLQLRKKGIFVNDENEDNSIIYLTVNITILRRKLDVLLSDFSEALEKSLK